MKIPLQWYVMDNVFWKKKKKKKKNYSGKGTGPKVCHERKWHENPFTTQLK